MLEKCGGEVLEVAESHVIEETEAKDYLQKHPERENRAAKSTLAAPLAA